MTDCLSPTTSGSSLPSWGQRIRNANLWAADFVVRYFHLGVLRQRIYQEDWLKDQAYLSAVIQGNERLSTLMERGEMALPTEFALSDLIERLEGDQGQHLSCNYVIKATSEEVSPWDVLTQVLGNTGEGIQSLDLRGLQVQIGSSQPQSPYCPPNAELDKLPLSSFHNLAVLALDATPGLGFDFAQSMRNAHRLQVLRLTAPERGLHGRVGIEPSTLARIVDGHPTLTTLMADVCTDADDQHSTVHIYQATRTLYSNIAVSSSLQKVDLRTGVQLEPAHLAALARQLENNYVICEFLPVQTTSGRIAQVMRRNRDLQTRLMNVDFDSRAFDAILEEVPGSKARERLRQLIADTAETRNGFGGVEEHPNGDVVVNLGGLARDKEDTEMDTYQPSRFSDEYV